MESSTLYSLLASLVIVVAIIAGTAWAYNEGYLDPVIEKIGVYLFRAKAMAEAKKMQAQGMKAGEDFVGCKSHDDFLLSLMTTETKLTLFLSLSSTQGQPAGGAGEDGCRSHWRVEEGSLNPHLSKAVGMRNSIPMTLEGGSSRVNFYHVHQSTYGLANGCIRQIPPNIRFSLSNAVIILKKLACRLPRPYVHGSEAWNHPACALLRITRLTLASCR
jgi:hypothetical protein